MSLCSQGTDALITLQLSDAGGICANMCSCHKTGACFVFVVLFLRGAGWGVGEAVSVLYLFTLSSGADTVWAGAPTETDVANEA